MSVESFTDVHGRDVVAADNAESIGAVKGFVLDPHGRSVEAIHIAGRGRKATVLPWPQVAAFGVDVVMAHRSPTTSGVVDEHERAAIKGEVTMIGSRVLSVDGELLGEVVDVEFDTDTGAIINAATDQGPIESSRFRSLGSFALVVDRSTPAP